MLVTVDMVCRKGDALLSGRAKASIFCVQE